MQTDKTHTDFGAVTIGADSVMIEATHAELYAWAHRQGAAWPCSTLEDAEHVRAVFDRGGLVEFEHPGTDDVMGDELSAYACDVLKLAHLPSSHPCYAVTVGQFIDADALTCPECGEAVWDMPHASKLAKCWNAEGHASRAPLAFD